MSFCCDAFAVHPPRLLALAEDLETLCEFYVIISIYIYIFIYTRRSSMMPNRLLSRKHQ